METIYVPEINELTDWIKNNVLDTQDLSHGENPPKFSAVIEPDPNERVHEDAPMPKVTMSREEEELSLLEYIIGIDGMS